jgi:hypothetical protein
VVYSIPAIAKLETISPTVAAWPIYTYNWMKIVNIYTHFGVAIEKNSLVDGQFIVFVKAGHDRSLAIWVLSRPERSDHDPTKLRHLSIPLRFESRRSGHIILLSSFTWSIINLVC